MLKKTGEPNVSSGIENLPISCLRDLSYALKINEIDTAAAMFGECRGVQDAGWSTVATAHEVF